MTSDDPRPRRRFLAGLAAAGGASLAGCSALSWGEETGPTFTAADAAGVLTDAPPAIEWPVPVVPTADAIDDGLERVDSLLADVPDPLEAATVPNGVVRKAIVDRRDEAGERRDEAAGATGDRRYHALRTTREARDAARAATTAFAAIEDETLVSSLREERRTVRSSVRDRLDSTAYRGADTEDELRRAALFYSRRESDLRRAARRLGRHRWEVDASATVVDIGAGAGALEFATATTGVWDHLEARHDERTDDAIDLTPVFDAALEASTDRVDSVDVPDRAAENWLEGVIDGGLDDRHLQQILWRAVDPVSSARDGLEEAVANGNRGIGLYRAVRFEALYRAFERVRDRIVDGTLSPPESIDEIRAERTAAIEAAESAGESLTGPSIGTYVLAEAVQSLEWTDERVRGAAGHDPETVVSLDTEYGDYARLRAQLEALPDAVETFRDRLLAA